MTACKERTSQTHDVLVCLFSRFSLSKHFLFLPTAKRHTKAAYSRGQHDEDHSLCPCTRALLPARARHRMYLRSYRGGHMRTGRMVASIRQTTEYKGTRHVCLRPSISHGLRDIEVNVSRAYESLQWSTEGGTNAPAVSPALALIHYRPSKIPSIIRTSLGFPVCVTELDLLTTVLESCPCSTSSMNGS